MRKALILPIALALSLVACTADEPVVFVSDGCSWVSPIIIGPDDSLSGETSRQILAHNRKWESNCDNSSRDK